MLKKQTWFVLALTYTILITIVSLVKVKPPVDIKVHQADKWVHFGIYVIFTILWFAHFKNSPKEPLSSKPILKSSFLAFLFGVLIEVLQHFNPYARSGDVLDVLANTIGIVIAVLILKKTKISRVLNSVN